MITIPIWLYVVSCLLGLPIFCTVIAFIVFVVKMSIDIIKQTIEEIEKL